MTFSKSYFVSGGNRGIGLSFLKQLSSNSNNLFIASVRNQDQVSKFADKIDVLMSNAGIINEITKILETPASVFSKLFTVNSIGPVLLVRALNPLLSKTVSPKTIFMSSIGGSIGGAQDDTYAAYGASKAALNYFMKMLSLGSKTHTFVAIHPGLVETDMVKIMIQEDPNGFVSKLEQLTPDKSVSLILKVINGLSIKDIWITRENLYLSNFDKYLT